MSLSQEPVFPILQQYFVCGYKDITGLPYAGRSGHHAPDGKAIRTTNGAGPHNLQLFVLAPDGVVLHCLPGYWNPHDLAFELSFAHQLYEMYRDPKLTKWQKDDHFRQMQLAHVQEHPPHMVRRSRMQSFDQKYEARHRLTTSDTIRDRNAVQLAMYNGQRMLPQQAFKTTDQIMHERMASRPLLPYERFDVAQYSDYGRPFYDKHEDERDQFGNRMTGAFQGQRMPRRINRRAIVREYR